LFRNPNSLILDEPTNDLDLPTLSVLENFLSEYQGCLLIVSHDRYFMDRLVDHMFVFEGNGEVRDFPGNYTQYRTWQKEQEKKQAEVKARDTEIKKQETAPVQEGVKKEKKKLSYKEQREFEQLEKEIPQLEAEKTLITVKMSDASLPYDELQKLSARITEVTTLLEEKEMRWLELSEYM
jgi:ATP-binding cassette subfamily F protein uup